MVNSFKVPDKMLQEILGYITLQWMPVSKKIKDSQPVFLSKAGEDEKVNTKRKEAHHKDNEKWKKLYKKEFEHCVEKVKKELIVLDVFEEGGYSILTVRKQSMMNVGFLVRKLETAERESRRLGL